MLGMERTSEKVARLVWFCGAARVAFLRATGSLSVQVLCNVEVSSNRLSIAHRTSRHSYVDPWQ